MTFLASNLHLKPSPSRIWYDSEIKLVMRKYRHICYGGIHNFVKIRISKIKTLWTWTFFNYSNFMFAYRTWVSLLKNGEFIFIYKKALPVLNTTIHIKVNYWTCWLVTNLNECVLVKYWDGYQEKYNANTFQSHKKWIILRNIRWLVEYKYFL